jgi:hypothetical protein
MSEIKHVERGAAMRSIPPQVEAPLIRIAEEQPEFVPVTGALVRHPGYPDGAYPERANTVLLAFRPSEDERKRLAEGADIYVALLTFGQPMQGIVVLAGKEDASAVYNVPAAEDWLGETERATPPGPAEPPKPFKPKAVG